MFKKSVHIDLLYQELPYEERFQAAKRDGFDAIELYWGWEGRDLHKIRELADKNGLAVSAISADLPKDAMISMCDPLQKEEYLESVKRSIEASKILGNKVIIAHAAAIDNKPPYGALTLTGEYSYNRKLCAMYDILKTIAVWGEQEGITFVLEPLSEIAHSGYFLKNSTICADIVEAVGSPAVRMLYDAYHAYLEEGRLCETISRYVQYFGLFHVADAPGRHEPGTGAVNWKNVLRHLNDLGYEGYVSFELYPESTTERAVAAIQDALSGLK
jgi:hydroxypyruvate isomerase